ncbi:MULTISPECIES: hypothetical protein [unclassified Thermosynechococcus]|uniref:hypothetical protein n=1 Tax=unclassified Thermosynechococcus TaxID=2622553 RepID=UPI00122E8645|nr:MULTISPECIES: hypothetical protein [unclassified Thermosynechococcus]MDR5639438.1 hypothetical protein [Thermosynechococcus sp. PP42]MDR7898534.1 hypothetical protein [Thermosynechococcus sp. JY1332]MDR7905937.1 hypothetical protein [Thermosynechococcus sp. JY1334]MDR7922056.1 hypothetical protein [Thermosynechococcus sp. HY213]MDR7993757.1 hypothetical protein [Thermosynechococcus sp. TG252]
MLTVISYLEQPMTFDSFFGPVTLQPGRNENVDERRWRNCKTHNADLQALLKKGLIVVEDVGVSS